MGRQKNLPKMVAILCSGFTMSQHFTRMIGRRNAGCTSQKRQNHMQKERVTHSWLQILSQRIMAGFDCPMEKRVREYCSELGKDVMVTSTMRISAHKVHVRWTS